MSKVKKFTAAFLVTALVLIVLIKSDKEIKNLISPSPDETAESYLTLISTGDIGLVRDVNYKIIQAKDPSYPFLKIADYLKDGDLTVGNLEGPLIDNCPIIREGFTFCGQSSNASGLTYAGIDAMNLANNHSTNFGLSGLEESEKILRSNGIVPFGSDKNIEYLKIRDKKIALIGFVELGNSWGGLNNATGENVSELVRTARQNADIVITSFHWGIEYTRKPTENQVALAHLAIDSGADIVLGNHPHWIQTTEVYKGKFISYAQGNTVFDQDWSQETKEGVLYKFVYRNGVFEKIGEKYTIIEDNVQPRFATEEEILKIKQKITQ